MTSLRDEDLDLGSLKPSDIYGATADYNKMIDPASLDEVEPFLEPHEQADYKSAWFNISNVTVGAGTLSMPFAMQKMGLALGIILVLIMGGLADYSLRLLLHTADWTHKDSFQGVAAMTFGRRCVRLVDVVVLALCFSCVLAYTILIGDLLPPMFQTWAGESDSAYLQREFVMGLAVACLILPLSIPRRIHFLRHASFVALSCMLYVFILVIVWAGISNFDDMEAGNKNRNIDISGGKELRVANWSQDIFFALPIVAFAFSSHIQVYKIYREMGVSDVPGMMNVVHLSVGACTLLYLGVGIFGYLCFYQVTSPNLLNNFTDESNGAVALAKIGLAIVLVASAPLFMLPLRDTLTNLLFSEETARQFSWFRHLFFTFVILGLAYLLAVVTPEVSDVLSLTGSLCSTAVMYLFPATFYLALEQNHTSLQDKPARNRAFGAKCVLVWGTVMCIAGTTISIYEFATKS